MTNSEQIMECVEKLRDLDYERKEVFSKAEESRRLYEQYETRKNEIQREEQMINIKLRDLIYVEDNLRDVKALVKAAKKESALDYADQNPYNVIGGGN